MKYLISMRELVPKNKVRGVILKIGILTFQFAHNYGAMLQARALKRYLENLGHDVNVLPYYPVIFQAQYLISPFVRGISVKHRIRKTLYYLKNAPQAKVFEAYKKEKIYGNKDGSITKEFWKKECLQEYCKDFDLIVFGSDQIWNNQITRADTIYFGEKINGRKIAFAASMGSATNLQEQMQIDYIRKFLPEFEAVSVREPEAKLIIETNIGKYTEIVCDPVFLWEKDEWRKHEAKVKIKQPYILLYMLEKDELLLRLAHERAKQDGLKIYEIHPTLAIKNIGTEQLKKIGPQEFLYLVSHAEYVCTNSFHGVSFSIIYNKRLIHIPNKKSPERTVAILKRLGIDNPKDNVYIEDLSRCNYNNLNEYIEYSKRFLNRTIQ